MQVKLEFPGCDKGISLMITDLAQDKGFKPYESNYNFDSERFEADNAVNEANHELGNGNSKAFSMLFNQFRWENTTGWEYWSYDYALIYAHAKLVAQKLGLELLVCEQTIEKLIDCIVMTDFIEVKSEYGKNFFKLV